MVYKTKSAYFDNNVGAPWAAAEYGPEEMVKLDRLFKHLGPLKGRRILEPGCGTGRLTKILSDRVEKEGLVVALDISPGMVDEARRRTGARRNVEIHLGPVENFPIKKNSYDFIICHQVFPHFEDKKKALMILSKLLNPNGRLIVIHFICLQEINDRHRKTGTAVEMDMMPEEREMRRLFNEARMEIAFILDDHLGYFLSASKKDY
jgi:ubiquinone/menaquinone biosynthesis C-methylase UbiE